MAAWHGDATGEANDGSSIHPFQVFQPEAIDIAFSLVM